MDYMRLPQLATPVSNRFFRRDWKRTQRDGMFTQASAHLTHLKKKWTAHR